jgi:hypothetical protein
MIRSDFAIGLAAFFCSAVRASASASRAVERAGNRGAAGLHRLTVSNS